MMQRSLVGAACLAALWLCVGGVQAQEYDPTAPTTLREEPTTMHAKGTFEVQVGPLSLDHGAEDASLGRFSLDKTFQGDLQASSKGQMLTAGTAVEGSMAYVAIEQVSGTLQGRSGTFVLQHKGTMNRGTPSLDITVVPDSGTGQLAGLTGKMTIEITDGKHFYDFEYTLPAAP